MNNIIEIYNDFYMSGDVEKFNDSLKEIGVDSPLGTDFKKLEEKVIRAINCIVTYLDNYGLDIELANGGYLTDMISKERSELRFAIDDNMVDMMLDMMLSKDSFPNIKFGCSVTQFNEEFMFEVTEQDISKKDLMFKALMTFIIGFPIESVEDLTLLRNAYIGTNGLVQAIGFISLRQDWFNRLLRCMASYGMSFMNWCIWFDGSWFDIRNQISSGFVTLPKDIGGNVSFVVCVSTLYLGEYFICSYRMFTVMYNNNLLGTIRFVDKEVPVENEDGSVINKVVLVPVYYKDTEEHLVSEIADKHYVYSYNALRDVGSGC